MGYVCGPPNERPRRIAIDRAIVDALLRIVVLAVRVNGNWMTLWRRFEIEAQRPLAQTTSPASPSSVEPRRSNSFLWAPYRRSPRWALPPRFRDLGVAGL